MARNHAAGAERALKDALDAQGAGDCETAFAAVREARACAEGAVLSCQDATKCQRFARGYAHASGEAPDPEYFGR